MIGFFKKGLKKTIEAIKEVVPTRQEKISRDILEEILLEADVEYDLIEDILERLPKDITREKLEIELLELFSESETELNDKPIVELIIGVNGAGKTTTIAKLANSYKKDGKKVLLGAGDTFRAAAIEQLSKWADKIDVPIIFTKQGHDPSAVVYDTILSGISRGSDRVLIDTAGRLHNQTNLANELKKIVRVAQKAKPEAPHRKILILDGTQGNSAINQAKVFNEMIGIDGIIITKLDGTAKGGAVFSIAKSLGIPILYIGVGEKQDDLIKFNKDEFVKSLLDEIYEEKK